MEQFGTYLSDCPHIVTRRQSNTRSAHDAEAEDILLILDLLDNKGMITNFRFGAVDLERLPKYGPEEVNLCSVVDRQVRIDRKVDELQSTVDAAAVTITDDRINKLLECTNAISQQMAVLLQSAPSARSSAGPTMDVRRSISPTQPDRSCNLVISGVAEDRDPAIWRDTVTRVLALAAGRDVRIGDAFRLGRFDERRNRPILVKLTSAWDRRVILSGAHKLSGEILFRRNVFINADEPPETRRRNTLRRLKSRAQRNGQHVSVSNDGVLSIDGEAVFCLNEGFISRRQVESSSATSNG